MPAHLARSQRTAHLSTAQGAGRSLLSVGDLLAGRYRVVRVLGEGGMGVVVEAYHELLDQRVAVKLLYRDVADGEAQSRLLLEARAAAKLQSEHVARVIDVDVGADGLPFIVMELLEGADLCEIVDCRGALPRWLVVDYVLQTLEGLAHAHGRAIIHRDLKPSNLFLANRPDGMQVIKILDFGISKSEDSPDRRTAQLTGGRTVLGSPPYMSPEQVRSPKRVDHRTDIWSLGICMYELLTNSMPFGGAEVQETFAQILEKEPTAIRALVTGVPEGLEQIVMRCLAKNRDERFSDVAELAKALRPYGSGTWIQSADRVRATLARSLEERTSTTRVRSGPVSSERIAIPSAPARRHDSQQPELHGTASTVARRFTLLEKKKLRLVGVACAATSLAGLVLMGVPYMQRRTEAAARTEAPPAAIESAPPLLAPKVVQTASGENDLPSVAPPRATVIGASPYTPEAASAKQAKAPPVQGGRGAATPAPRPVKPAAATSTAKAIPEGLPKTRSGT